MQFDNRDLNVSCDGRKVVSDSFDSCGLVAFADASVSAALDLGKSFTGTQERRIEANSRRP